MARIALGVSGGIGAYKAVEVVAAAAEARPPRSTAVMTRTRPALRRSADLRGDHARARDHQPVLAGAERRHRAHRARAPRSDLLLVAPATANIIGKFAHGIADDFLSSLYLATTAPVLLAPAMNTHMWSTRRSQANLDDAGGAGRALRRAGRGLPGVRLGGEGPPRRTRRRSSPPCSGGSAARRWPDGQCWSRPGRPSRTSTRCASSATARAGGWAIAVAREAARRGAAVVLVDRPDPSRSAGRGRASCGCAARARCIAAVMAAGRRRTRSIMAAAVADYTPEAVEAQKVGKA